MSIAQWGQTPTWAKKAAPKPITAYGRPGIQGSALQGAATAAVAPQYSATGVKPAAAPSAPSAPTGVSSTADPRDPTYWTDAAKIQNTFKNTMAGYDLQETNGRTSLLQALGDMERQQPVDISNARGSYNDNGLFYSSRLGGAEGDIVGKYDRAKTDAQSGFDRLISGLAIDRNTTTSQFGPGGTAYSEAFNNAVGRQIGRDTDSAANNTLATLPADNQTAPAGASPAYGSAAAGAGVNPSNWVKTTYTNAQGHVVHVMGDGTKYVNVGGAWKKV